MKLADIKRSFSAACRRAELTGVSPHTLRHNCATWLTQRGVDEWEAAAECRSKCYIGFTVITTRISCEALRRRFHERPHNVRAPPQKFLVFWHNLRHILPQFQRSRPGPEFSEGKGRTFESSRARHSKL